MDSQVTTDKHMHIEKRVLRYRGRHEEDGGGGRESDRVKKTERDSEHKCVKKRRKVVSFKQQSYSHVDRQNVFMNA